MTQHFNNVPAWYQSFVSKKMIKCSNVQVQLQRTINPRNTLYLFYYITKFSAFPDRRKRIDQFPSVLNNLPLYISCTVSGCMDLGITSFWPLKSSPSVSLNSSLHCQQDCRISSVYIYTCCFLQLNQLLVWDRLVSHKTMYHNFAILVQL